MPLSDCDKLPLHIVRINSKKLVRMLAACKGTVARNLLLLVKKNSVTKLCYFFPILSVNVVIDTLNVNVTGRFYQ